MSVFNTISPTSPTLTGFPSGLTISTSNCGVGFPIEPGLGSIPIRFPTVRVVSVCPKPSISFSPVRFLNVLKTSGLRASPAMVACSIDDRSYFERSSLMKNLYIVGGAQKVVILYFLNMGRILPALNRSKSYVNMHASQSHCP